MSAAPWLETAALLPIPGESLLRVAGRDAGSFLQNLLTQELVRMTPGDSRPAALADRKGHLVADLWVARRPDDYLLRVPASRGAIVLAAFDAHRFSEKVSFELEALDARAALLVGRRAIDCMASWAAAPVSAVGDLGEAADLAYLRVRELGPADFLLYSASLPVAAWSASLLASASLPVTEITWDAFDLERVQRGVARFGVDADSERLVPEAGFGDRIAYNKGCFLGQEPLARLHWQGQLNWRLCRLSLESRAEDRGSTDPQASDGEELVNEAAERVGWIAHRAALAAGTRALGYLHRKYREQGGPLATRGGEKVVEWSVAAPPAETP